MQSMIEPLWAWTVKLNDCIGAGVLPLPDELPDGYAFRLAADRKSVAAAGE
jgi:hypothetical protein